MEVEHRLPAVLAVVRDQAITGALQTFTAGEVPGDEEEPAEQRGIVHVGVPHGPDVAPRDQQDVHGGLRVDVPEGDDVVVLVDDVRRDLSSGDLAEQAVAHRILSTDAPSGPSFFSMRS